MNMEQLLPWELVGKTEVLGENLPQSHSVHEKSHTTWPWIENKTAAVESQRPTA
jgi:hypothetical protein